MRLICTAAVVRTLHLAHGAGVGNNAFSVVTTATEEFSMLRFNRPVTLRLFSGETTALRSDEPVRLRVACGLVWLTRAGDHDDHFLGAGQTMELQSGVPVTLGAEQTASLRLEPVTTPWAQRVWARLRGAVATVSSARGAAQLS